MLSILLQSTERFPSLNIAKIQKQLEQEHRALDLKYKFITELKALMEKYSQTGADLLAILEESDAAAAAGAARRGGASRTGRAAAAAPKARRKQARRPLRKFRHPNTGEVVEARAPQVNKVIRGWAEELKVDWRQLEV